MTLPLMSNFSRLAFDKSGALRTLIQYALPQHCALCTAACGDTLVCAACNGALPRIAEACPLCALPTAGGAVCGACLRKPPPFDATRAAFVYAYPVDRLIHSLKYGARLAYAEFFADALAARITARPDVLVALPLAASRQRQRGFNQAQEIARQLARSVRVPVAAGLTRIRDTPAQASLPWHLRAKNVAGAFAGTTALAGKRIAIVDDVMTTGATLAAAASAARRSGAVGVEAWVVARTLPPVAKRN